MTCPVCQTPSAQARATIDQVRVNCRRCGAFLLTREASELLLAGQERAPVALVRDSGMLTLAAAFDSGWDFVAILGLGGGMPTRVSLPEVRLAETIEKINAAAPPAPRG